MGQVKDKILGIAKEFVRKYGAEFSSFQESEIVGFGRSVDAGSMTTDQAADRVADLIDKRLRDKLSSKLSSDDKKDIKKQLNKLSH